VTFPEIGELADDVRRLFDELERLHPAGGQRVAGECSPELDVFESDHAFEIVVDLPGVRTSAVRVLIKQGTVVVAGEKAATESAAQCQATFHRVERTFGRFARAIRLPGAIDAGHARAALLSGELTITVPKIAERRGREIQVKIE
jgi:HSP20 family protein